MCRKRVRARFFRGMGLAEEGEVGVYESVGVVR